MTVSGRLVFQNDRKLPKAEPVPAWMIKDADMWKPFGPLTYAKITINPNNRGVADAIVFLRPDSDDRKADFPADRIHPDLADAKHADHPVVVAGPHFAPRVLAVRAGDRLVFENRLPERIVVGYTELGEKDNGADNKFKWNVMIGTNDKYASDPLPARQRVDHFNNSIHHWMDGFVWAFDHPYFAVTDANGRFELANVPVGTWRLVTWHQVAGWGPPGRLGTKIVVAPNRTGRHELDPTTFARDNWPE
jgi:hypothetical protein